MAHMFINLFCLVYGVAGEFSRITLAGATELWVVIGLDGHDAAGLPVLPTCVSRGGDELNGESLLCGTSTVGWTGGTILRAAHSRGNSRSVKNVQHPYTYVLFLPGLET
jgi:hypothetical protein